MNRQKEDGHTDYAIEGRAPTRPSSSANLPVVEEADVTGEVAELYERFRSHFQQAQKSPAFSSALPRIRPCCGT